MTHRPDIQILRGFAVILVVMFHLNAPLFARGFLGVDAFFVISGFLMGILYRQGEYRQFYARRAARLLPAYFATVIATVMASALITLPSEHNQVVQQGIFASFFASNIGFWAQNSYFSKSDFNPLLHLWSLAVEIQFYALVPLMFWLRARLKPLLIALAALSVLGAFAVLMVSPKTAFFITPFRIWQFLCGAGVAWAFTVGGVPKRARPLLGLGGLIAAAGIAMAYPINGEALNVVLGHPGLAAVLITLAISLVLAFGLPVALAQSLLGKAMSKLGDWSYSIYLAHFPVITLILYQPFSGTQLLAETWLQTGIILGLIALFSSVLYLGFDRPRRWPSRFIATGLLCATVALVSLSSGYLARLRFEPQQLNILDALDDRDTYRCGKLIRFLSPSAIFCDVTQPVPKDAPSLLLLGDSHADSIKRSFADVAEKMGFQLFFAVSNAPILSSPDTSRLLAEVQALGIDGIVIHFSSGNALRAFDKGFIQAASPNLPVTWLLPVPSYGSSVPSTLWARGIKRSDPEFAPVNIADLQDIRTKIIGSGVHVFDPAPILCPNHCLLADDTMKPFYFDAGHLTLTGSALLKPIFADILTWQNQQIQAKKQ